MLAVQIAVLVALHNVTYFQASSWQQLWNNFGILFNLSFGGCLPVLFTLLLLRMAGKKSWYIIISTTCCVALSVATWFVTYNASPDSNNIIYTGPDLPACGGSIAPIKYCYR